MVACHSALVAALTMWTCVCAFKGSKRLQISQCSIDREDNEQREKRVRV